MTEKEQIFEEQIKNTIAEIEHLLIVKGREYRRNSNVYHNFEEGAKMTGQTRERVLHGFLLKHLVSYNDMLNDLEKGEFHTVEKINEKFNDILVYFLIQKTLFLSDL